ncbi:N-glycosylase/DNA lyase [Kwoniella heveanensis CBS 569]|nr:N-glycosylase/DNA lyase [Kwoniella heveanensis CBS 569]
MSRPPFPAGWSSIPLNPRNLTLANTLPVGQSFLWRRHALQHKPEPGHDQPLEEFSRAIDDPPRVVCLRQSPHHLHFTAIHPNEASAELDQGNELTRKWLFDYFQLDTQPDLEKLYGQWRQRDPGLFGKVEVNERAVGVRVLRQDPWECLIAFITSTNNHIPRITSLLNRVSEAFSPPIITLEEHTYHLFPEPNSWPDKDLDPLLRGIGFGYRAPFIESTLQSLKNEFSTTPGAIQSGLLGWRDVDVGTVREKLIGLKGVGRKVADCVMLMSMDKPSLIPIDTHLAAIAARHPSFPARLRNKTMSKQIYDETQQFLLDRWGSMGGWCQAVMFAADLPAVKPKVVTKVVTASIKRVIHDDEKPPPLKRTRSATRRQTTGLTVRLKEEV